MTNSYCFITEKFIPENEPARFTHEFDAWVSKEGQQHIDNSVATGEIENNPEWLIIYEEWLTQGPSDDELYCDNL